MAECTCRNCGGRDKCNIRFERLRICCSLWRPKSIWIPCRERLPENGQECIVCMADKSIRLAVWLGDYDERGVWQIRKKLYRTRTVPAWMPMPDAYEPLKEGDNDA